MIANPFENSFEVCLNSTERLNTVQSLSNGKPKNTVFTSELKPMKYHLFRMMANEVDFTFVTVSTICILCMCLIANYSRSMRSINSATHDSRLKNENIVTRSMKIRLEEDQMGIFEHFEENYILPILIESHQAMKITCFIYVVEITVYFSSLLSMNMKRRRP